MKKILFFLTLISSFSFGQTIDVPKAGRYVYQDGTNPTPGTCELCLQGIVVDANTGVMTVTYSNGTTYISPPLKGAKGDKGDVGQQGIQGIAGPIGPAGPQGLPGPAGICPSCPPTGGGGTIKGIYDVTAYGATGSGSIDDRAAIQAAIDAAILNKGKLYIPNPSNYYRINGTLRFEPKGSNQAFFDVEGQGHWERQIVYQGPSNQPAVVIDGMKGGSFTRFMVKIGDGVSGCVGIDIGTRIGGSTAGFSFYDCTVTLNRGAGNQGWRLGEIAGSPNGDDISQIEFIGCKAEGWPGPTGFGSWWPGQIGFNITGQNTLALTWVGGSALFNETAVKLEQGGSITFHSFQGSNNKVDFWLQWANILTIDGGRWESGKKFLKVDQMSAHPIVNVTGAIVENYKPTDGMMVEYRAPGTLNIDGCAFNTIGQDFDARMFTLSAPASHPYGTFSIRGGKINANTQPNFPMTISGWRASVENVVDNTSNDHTGTGYFTNRSQ